MTLRLAPLALALAAPLLAPAPAAAQTVTTVGVGNPQRVAILDALRPAIERGFGQPVKFLVNRIRSDGRWAFVVAEPQTPAGRPIDMRRTRYASAMREGVMDGNTVYALLRKGPRGWTLTASVVGPTDVAWDSWDTEYGAPRAIFQ